MGKSRITWGSTAGNGLLAVLVCFIAACAAGPYAQVPASGPPPAVVVALGSAPAGFAAAAEAVSRSALAGSSVTFDAADGTAADVRIALRLTWRNITEREYEAIWRTTTLFLFTLYPSTCRHREYRLDADVAGAGGFARSYAAQDTTVAWLWLLHGSHCGDEPTSDEVESVSRRLLRDVYADMARDQVLDSAVRGIMPPPSPQVQVETDRAAAIVEQVMRLDRNFGAWTLVASDSVPADYRLDLRFDVRQGEFSGPRALLGIGTVGIFGVCEASTVRLVATIADRGVQRTRAYVLEESFRSAMEGMAATAQCERVDETTHPEVFAKVIRRLFERLATDRAIDRAMPAAGATLPPLVRIAANGHEDTILSEIAKTAPLPRFLFTDADVPPDYRLEMDVQYTGGGRDAKQGIASEAAQGFLLGLTGRWRGCLPMMAILTARVAAADGGEVARYEIQHEFSPSGSTDAPACIDNELSNPEPTVWLVGELLRRMKQDGVGDRLSEPGGARP